MVEYNICALRGRDIDNPSFRGCSNANFHQRFEIQRGGYSNTITSVGKDNLLWVTYKL